MIKDEIIKQYPPFDGKKGGRLKDLTGQKFGKLTVLYRGQNDSLVDKHAAWICQCECGNIKKYKSNDLKSGKVIGCGCVRNQVAGGRYLINEIGNTYGFLTVLERDGSTKAGTAKWKCRCKCGNVVSVTGSHLRDGHTMSCGCLYSAGNSHIQSILSELNIPYESEYSFNDLLGERKPLRFDFKIIYKNTLIMIEYDGAQHYRPAYWDTEESFNLRKENDKSKDDYCNSHSIILWRIPYVYDTREKIKQQLLKLLQSL